MKQGLNLQELASEIMRQSQNKRDFLAPTDKLWAKADGKTITLEVQTNGQASEFGLTTGAHSQIANKLGIPGNYYNRMAEEMPDLLTTNINAWLRKEPERRLVRTLDGKVRAFLSDRYAVWQDNELALAASLPVLAEKKDLQFPSLLITEKKLYLQCYLPTIRADLPATEKQKGDILYAGVTISNSETGWGRFTVERLIYVLSCTNGMVRGESIGRRHISRRIEEGEGEMGEESFYSMETIRADMEAFKLKVRDHVKEAFNEIAFHNDVKQVENARQRRIEAKNLDATVVEIGTKQGLLKSEIENVLARVIESGDLSSWGIAQGVTSLANDIEDNDRVVELERIGGKIIDLPETAWKIAA